MINWNAHSCAANSQIENWFEREQHNDTSDEEVYQW